MYVKHNNWEPKSVLIMTKKLLYDKKIAMNGMKIRPSSLRSHTVTSFNENNI